MGNYDLLNPMQKEAVFCTEGPLLVLAGAGSGKTRVLTYRIAHLIEEKEVNPWNIMAITFTNKAAGEMRERVDAQVEYGSDSIWVSTFHSTCVRILRRHIEFLGYETNFTIYDRDDQKTLLKQIYKSLNIDSRMYKERAVIGQISSAKDELVSPEDFLLQAAGDYYRKKVEGSNFVDIGFQIDERTGRVILMGAIDNLVKGAAGQAVQNMNLMFGLPEQEGLRLVPMFP